MARTYHRTHGQEKRDTALVIVLALITIAVASVLGVLALLVAGILTG